jgi:hypothetical protein
LALTHERVKVLTEMADHETRLLRSTVARLMTDPDGDREGLTQRFRVLSKSLDMSLAAIAAECGGRPKPKSLRRSLEDFCVDLARREGYDPEAAVRIARMVAADAE